MMPKRNPRHLDALRIEVNDRERELIEQAILVNGISGVARGLGNAVGGLGLALGAIGAVIVWKEGAGWFKEKLDIEREEWIQEECSQEKYNEMAAARQGQWEKAAKQVGRYGPAVGDHGNLAWWYALPPNGNAEPLTFEEWELELGPLPLYDEWCVEKRRVATTRRRSLVSILFPPLALVGVTQYGFKDWFAGRK
jgi:hypothetical protein